MKKIYWLTIAAIPALLFPLFAGSFETHTLIYCYYYIVVASSWNLVAGFSGQLSLAQAAFAGLGAYSSALFVMHTGISPFIGILISAILGWGISYSIGYLCLRLKGSYLTLATLGFAETIRLLITIEYPYTGGSLGLGFPPHSLIEPFFQTTSKIPYYYFMLGILAVSMFIIYKVVHSNIGLYLRAIRDDEDAASAMGVEVAKWRTFAFSVSGLLTGLAGAFTAHYELILSPFTLLLSEMSLIMAMAVFGGLGSFAGPILGTFIVFPVSEYIRLSFGGFNVIIFGIVLILMMRFFPGGIYALIKRMISRIFTPKTISVSDGGSSKKPNQIVKIMDALKLKFINLLGYTMGKKGNVNVA